jgi:hypothetical protein
MIGNFAYQSPFVDAGSFRAGPDSPVSRITPVRTAKISTEENALRYAWKLSTGVSCRKNRG